MFLAQSSVVFLICCQNISIIMVQAIYILWKIWTPYESHIWALLVLHYPRNMVIYHYPLIGVIYMAILHVFIIKNYPIFSQIIPLNPQFGWFTPLYWILENLYTKSISLNITRLYESKQQCSLILVSRFW